MTALIQATKIKIVIFDLDGTLVDAYKAVSNSVNYALRKMNCPLVSDEAIKRNVGWGEKNLIYSFVGSALAKNVLKIYRKHHKNTLHKGVKFLPGARALITRLHKKGTILAIASNRPSVFTKIILKALNMEKLFRFVVCVDNVKKPKPAADMLRLILKKSRLHAREALYVGDMAIDMVTGRRSAVHSVGVSSGSCTHKELLAEKPHAVIRRISDLEVILRKTNKN